MNKKKLDQIVEKVTLIKIETSYIDKTNTYFYSIKLNNLEEELLLESKVKLENIQGMKFDYELDMNTNEVNEFNFF